MSYPILIGSTDFTKTVFIPDPASTDGSGKTGLVAANLTVSYTRVETDNDVVVTDVTSSLNNLSALTDAHTDWGLKEVSPTLAPGLYRLDIADAVFASGAWTSVVYVMITTSAAAASPIEFDLVAYNKLDGVRLGLTALPNAAAGANGGLPTGNASGQVAVATLANDSVTAAALASDAVDEIWAKALSDLSAVPGATASALAGLNWVYMLARNKRTQTATTETVFKDDGSTTASTSTKSDDGTTFTRGEFA